MHTKQKPFVDRYGEGVRVNVVAQECFYSKRDEILLQRNKKKKKSTKSKSKKLSPMKTFYFSH